MPHAEELGSDWTGWVSASSTHNATQQDRVVDWLNFCGRQAGFVPDGRRPDHDPRFSYVSAILRQSWAFERNVVKWLSTLYEVRQIGRGPSDTRVLAKRRETETAMRAGVPILAQAILWDPEARTEGMPDLLIRSDVLARLCPGRLRRRAARRGFHTRAWHMHPRRALPLSRG